MKCSPTAPAPAQAQGFTLLEIVISMVLLGILAMVGTSMLGNSVSTNQKLSTLDSDLSTARYALERVSREIREIALPPQGQDVLTVVGTTDLTFTRSNPNTSVRLTYTKPTLYMAYGTGALTPLASDIQSLKFRFFLSDGTEITNPVAGTLATVRLVRIDITVLPSTSASANPIALSTQVKLRNL